MTDIGVSSRQNPTEGDEDEDDDKTLRADISVNLPQTSDDDFSGRDYSSSPSRFDGADIFERLNEMSEQTDRIDSILEQRLSASSSNYNESLRSDSPRGRLLRSRSPTPRFLDPRDQPSDLAGGLESGILDTDDEVD